MKENEKDEYYMIKVNFGCGGNRLNGWNNHDMEVDITKRLPYSDNSVNFIFAEHVLEHVTIQEAFSFLEECYRIMVTGGVIKIIVPTILNITKSDDDYHKFVGDHKWSDGSYKGAIKSLLFCHGHKTMWDNLLLCKVLNAIGFTSEVTSLTISKYPELRNLVGHHREIGERFNSLESTCVEGLK